MTKEKLNYSIINHHAREDLGISINTYFVADSIYQLSHNPNSQIYGWCYASKDFIAEFLSITRMTVFRSINELIEKGLVIKNDDQPNLLQTTALWYEKVIINKQNVTDSNKMLLPPYKNVTVDSNKMLLNKDKDIKINNKDKGNYSNIESITDIEIKKIANDYGTTLKMVRFVFEQLKLYDKKDYSNYYLALRKWVVRHLGVDGLDQARKDKLDPIITEIPKMISEEQRLFNLKKIAELRKEYGFSSTNEFSTVTKNNK